MVLDEPKENDDVYQINGFTMLIEKDLHETTKDVTVDYVTYGMGSGFKLSAQVPVGGGSGGSGCGSSCSC
jgi:iron-sulfur cluster assembly protein